MASRDVKAIIFDIDGTLTYEDGWYILSDEIGSSSKKHREIFTLCYGKQISSDEAIRRFVEDWQSTGKANKRLFEEVFSRMPLRKGAEEIIKYLREKGYLLCLITGNMELYAKKIAERLGITDYYANSKLFWDENDELTGLTYDFDEGKRKLHQFLDYCKLKGLQPAECAMVGDSWNDAGIFQATGRGIAIQTNIEDKEIEAVAWKKVSDLLELRVFL